jgi:16S rRNA (guanine966-N2)-methyltransferase
MPRGRPVERRGRGRAERRDAGQRNELRIIGGKWRGRRVHFPDLPELRPSPDRVRETLFNWLAPVIEGARCLDLFAGSGALGLEAASRGAASVVLVDRDPRVRAALESSVERLGADVGIVCDDAFAWLASDGADYDVVFVDPPFGEGLASRACTALAASGRLTPGARVYIECEAEAGAPDLPAGWMLLRSRRAGRVGYHLAEAAPAGAPEPAG